MRLRRRSNEPGLEPAPGRSSGRTWRLGVALLVPLALTAAAVRGANGSATTGTSSPVADVAASHALPAKPERQSCIANRLLALGGGHGNATAVSSNGLIVGIGADSAGATYPVLWKGARQTIKIPAQLFGAVPTGVNRHGVVVGTAYRVGANIPVGWWWIVGQKVQLLQVRSGEVAIPEAINDAGAVAGAIVNDEEHAEGEVVDDVERAAFWPSVHAAARQLGPLQGDEGAHAYAISDKGVIGGVSSGASFRPVIWDRHGRPTRLLTRGSRAGTVHGFARNGRPLGDAVIPGHGMQGVQWDTAGQPHPLVSARVLATMSFGSTATAKVPMAPVTGYRTTDAVVVAGTAAGTGSLLVGYTVVADGSRFATSWRCI